MSLKTCRRMAMAEHVTTAVYEKGQSLFRMSNPQITPKKRPKESLVFACSLFTDSSSNISTAPSQEISVPRMVKRIQVSPGKTESTKFLDPVPGVGEYNLTKYSDFAGNSEPRIRASPAIITQPDAPTHNTAPVGAYDLPPPPKISRNWSFGKVPEKNPHAPGRPVPAEVLFRSSRAMELMAVQRTPGPDTYDFKSKKDERMGVFTKDKRDREKKLKDLPIGPGDYLKDIKFLKSARSALLSVVGRVEPELPFRRKEKQKFPCERLRKVEAKISPRQAGLVWGAITTSSWSTAPKEGIFSQTDSGPGFIYRGVDTWFPENHIKQVTSMRPASVPVDERFAVHRMGHLDNRIWGPF